MDQLYEQAIVTTFGLGWQTVSDIKRKSDVYLSSEHLALQWKQIPYASLIYYLDALEEGGIVESSLRTPDTKGNGIRRRARQILEYRLTETGIRQKDMTLSERDGESLELAGRLGSI